MIFLKINNTKFEILIDARGEGGSDLLDKVNKKEKRNRETTAITIAFFDIVFVGAKRLCLVLF